MIETNGFDQSEKNMFRVVYEITSHPQEFITSTFSQEYFIDSVRDLDLFFEKVKESASNSGIAGRVDIDNHSASFVRTDAKKEIRLYTRKVEQKALDEIDKAIALEFDAIMGKS